MSRPLKVWITTALALSLATPALAAAQKPGVTTGIATNRTASSATLTGTLNPKGIPTTYQFQYGPTKAYGSGTASASAGAGNAPVNVSAAIAGLAPGTTYHYRLVASNRTGRTAGADRAFTTAVAPLGLSLAARPNPVRYGKSTVLAGTLSGAGSAGRQVVLQSNPFPYTGGFERTGDAISNPQGAFSFAPLAPGLNTRYRVVVPARPGAVSPIVNVGVKLKVNTTVNPFRVRKGKRVRFSGKITPAQDGARIAIQKLKGTSWVTVTGTTARDNGSSSSRYSKRIRPPRGGRYRVFVEAVDGRYESNSGRPKRVRVR